MLGVRPNAFQSQRDDAGQGKTRMVKATLLKSQSAAIYIAILAKATDTPVPDDGMGLMSWPITPQPVRRASRRGVQWTNGAPKRVASPISVTTGCPKQAVSSRPAWVRSRHSIQMPGVMPGTAPHGETVQPHKGRATGPKPGATGRRAAVAILQPQIMGCADATRYCDGPVGGHSDDLCVGQTG